MGHTRLQHLPRTRRWKQVIDLVGSAEGTAAAIASATVDAIDAKFTSHGEDAGLVRATWLLAQLPIAARSGDFAAALRELGVQVSAAPTVTEITAAVSSAIEGFLGKAGNRTDVAEMALGAAAETLAHTLSQRTASLFPTASDTADAVAELATDKQFGRLARDFFAKFTERNLRYFVDRELALHVGADRRFHSLAEQKQFSSALTLHCQQAAKIVEAFAGGWWSKARFEKDLSEERTRRFVSYALKKMRDEIRRGTVE